MNATILNRDFEHPADGWYHIEARGEHPNRAAGIVQVLDDEALHTIVNRFNAAAQAGQLRHGHELLIDHEHFKDAPDQETRAYGWLQELQNRADGLYARIRWTATGQAAVDGGDYRFFSTEYAPADLTVLDEGPPRRARPLQLAGLSLTNMNNNRGQKPITNRTPLPGANASGENQPPTDRTNPMKSIATKLGLAPEASEEAILGALAKLQKRLAALEESEADNQPLKNRLAELESEQVAGLLDLHGVRDEKVRHRLQPLLTSLSNREERISALLDLGHRPADPKAARPPRILNRADGRTGAPAAMGTESDDDRAKALKIAHRCNQLKAGGIRHEQAWALATSEINAGK